MDLASYPGDEGNLLRGGDAAVHAVGFTGFRFFSRRGFLRHSLRVNSGMCNTTQPQP